MVNSHHRYARDGASLCLDCPKELVECIGKELHPLFEELRCNSLHRDSYLGKASQGVLCFLNSFGQAGPGVSVLSEVSERLWGYGVHRVRADEFVYIYRLGIVGVLRARACPEYPLRVSPLCGNCLPTLATENAPIGDVSQLGVGNRDLADETPERTSSKARPRSAERRVKARSASASRAGSSCER